MEPNNKKKQEYCIKASKIFIYIFFIVAIIISIIIIVMLIINKRNDLYLEYEYFYNSTKDNYDGYKYHDGFFLIEKEAKYKICAYGAKAYKGGRGGEICGINEFKKFDILTFKLGGREAGGKGGKCGVTDRDISFNGAGYGKINILEDFIIVAGGGGGDSEKSLNKGGDAEKDGDGELGGKAGTQTAGGQRGGSNGNNGSKYEGGNADSSKLHFCGGGGGSGYYGGGSGGYGSMYLNGGGGGGSNYCKANECLEAKINEMDYSGVRIYRFKK